MSQLKEGFVPLVVRRGRVTGHASHRRGVRRLTQPVVRIQNPPQQQRGLVLPRIISERRQRRQRVDNQLIMNRPRGLLHHLEIWMRQEPGHLGTLDSPQCQHDPQMHRMRAMVHELNPHCRIAVTENSHHGRMAQDRIVPLVLGEEFDQGVERRLRVVGGGDASEGRRGEVLLARAAGLHGLGQHFE